ncbi:DUF2524 family protein [Aquibacillus salsiterrae]|uniref:YtzC family protein n=1 Tax=Aquibacillus salsiterrae TaxID=2950439 RepID=A0A9X4AFQ5_9BACI|nr:DUF2524 family protein [Aquibacillus salsiterrae]MDC3418267.1 YtzC family protein [Aquibacillus salsiterrae]
MATRESVDNLVARANQCLSEAGKVLDLTNRNGYEVDESYSNAQRQLADVEEDIRKMMISASHEQRDQLHRIHLKVSQYMNDMILDHVEINKFE